MASTKVPQFKSSKEKAKWDALHNKAGTSLNKITQGTASPADFQNITKTLKSLSDVAEDIFNKAYEAAVAQSELLKEQADYRSKDIENILNDVFAQQLPELLIQIKDVIEIESLEQEYRFEKTLGTKFEFFSSLLPPKDLPSTDDVLAIFEASLEQEEQRWTIREKQLVNDITESVIDAVQGNIFNAAMSTLHSGIGFSSRRKASTSAPLLQSPVVTDNNWEVVDDRPNLAKQALSFISNKGSSNEGISDTSYLPSFNRNSRSDVRTSLNNSLQLPHDIFQAIKVAATEQTRLQSEIIDLLRAFTKQEDDDEEEKKPDSWWRSFNKWVGNKYDNVKRSISGSGSWLSTIASGLASILLAPQLYETIAKQARDLFTWDNIKTGVTEAWDFMYTKGKEVIEWVWDKLNLGKTFKNAASVVGRSIKRGGNTIYNGTVRALESSEHALAAIPHFITSFFHRKNTNTVNNSSPLNISSAPYSSFSNQVASVSKNRSSVGSTTIRNGNVSLKTGGNVSTTRSIGDNRVTISPSFSIPRDGQPAPAQSGVTRSTSSAVGANRIGINSFNINSGIDDSLALMNLSIISG